MKKTDEFASDVPSENFTLKEQLKYLIETWALLDVDASSESAHTTIDIILFMDHL